jgi:hypothetical protein
MVALGTRKTWRSSSSARIRQDQAVSGTNAAAKGGQALSPPFLSRLRWLQAIQWHVCANVPLGGLARHATPPLRWACTAVGLAIAACCVLHMGREARRFPGRECHLGVTPSSGEERRDAIDAGGSVDMLLGPPPEVVRAATAPRKWGTDSPRSSRLAHRRHCCHVAEGNGVGIHLPQRSSPCEESPNRPRRRRSTTDFQRRNPRARL